MGGVNVTGNLNTSLGYHAGVGVDGLTNATAIGANAFVSESNALVLGGTDSNAVDVGIGTTTPQSTLQVGSGQVTSFGSYVQIPTVMSRSEPPASDCSTTFAGRLVLQYNSSTSKRTTLWACNGAGTWVSLGQG
jgi:hypothetical protein